MIEIIGQSIGIIAAVFNILSYQARKNKTLYLCQTLGSSLFALSFLLLGSYTAAFMNIISILRGAFLGAGKKFSNAYTFALVQILFIASGILTYDGFTSLLITAVQLVGTVALWSRNGKAIRITQFILISPAWLLNNIVVLAIGGIITEAFTMISIIVSIIRYGFNGFETEKANSKK